MNSTQTLRLALTAVLLLTATRIMAEPIALDRAGAERLGLEYARPVRVDGTSNLTIPARVTAPPAATSAVTTAFAAQIERLWKAEGEPVVAGEPLVRLRSPDLVALQGEFLRYRATVDLKRSMHERDKALVDAGAIAARRYEESKAAWKEARVYLSETRARLAAMGMTNEQINTLAASGHLDDSLDLLAPHDGYVLARHGEVGQRVEAMTLIYRLARGERVWLEARVPAEHASAFAAGQRLDVEGTAEPAVVLHIGYGVDVHDNSVMVRAEFARPPGTLRPGQFVMARWQGVAGTAWELPPTALVHHDGADYVFVRVDAGIDAREVDIASRAAGLVRITRGLGGGENVVVSGAAGLKALWLGAGEHD